MKLNQIYKLTVFLLWSTIIYSTTQAAIIKGKVEDTSGEPLSGANIILKETTLGTTSKHLGQFSINNIPAGDYDLVVTFVGFERKEITFSLKENQIIEQNITLEQHILKMDPVVVTAQKIFQQVQDVPISMKVFEAPDFKILNIRDLDVLSQYAPGLNVQVQTVNRPNFVIRGLTSDEIGASSQPRVSVFYNNIPISRNSGALLELYDMERVEIIKGPQGTLFGRGAQIGSVHFISNKPKNRFEASISLGMGNYGQREYTGMVNLPLSNTFLARISGTYVNRNGFIKNTYGGKLNEKELGAFRFSFRYLFGEKTIVDIMLNYQKDSPGGTAFFSKTYPNQEGNIDVFGDVISLERGSELSNEREIVNSALSWVYYFNANLDLTSITSYRKHNSGGIWDGDGSAAPALDFEEFIDTKQFSQELRLNYNTNKRLRGFFGISYWTEQVNYNVHFSPNEQSLFHLFFDPRGLVDSRGNPIYVPVLPAYPELGPLAGMSLPSYHTEESFQRATNSAIETVIDGTYKFSKKLNFTAGVCLVLDKLKLDGANKFIAGEPSTLGNLTGNYPNVLFAVNDLAEINKSFSGVTGRVVTKYSVSEELNTYFGFAWGRRPNVIQFRADGQAETLADEKLHSFDWGIKGNLNNQLVGDVAIFYYKYNDFQTRAWVADQQTGEFQLIIKDGGKATAHGLETNIRYALSPDLHLFGSYAFIQAKFDDKDSQGNAQEFAGNKFRLTPDHSFSLRANFFHQLSKTIRFFLIPSFVYKSHHFFEDENTPGLEQDGYDLVHLRTGIVFEEQQIEFSLFGYNIFDKRFLIGAGNAGSLFGIPTFVPGLPITIGTKIKWDF